MRKPAVAMTCGDTAGVGPEIAIRACTDPRVLDACRPILFWPRDLPGPEVECVEILDGGGGGPADHALASLEAGLGAVRDGRCRGLVTAPVHKKRMSAVCPGFTGHTEWLAGSCDIDPSRVVMVFTGRRVRTACVTRHLPLSGVPGALGERLVAHAGLMLWAHARYELGIPQPRLAVTGVNPHASDGGLLGTEEERVVEPAVRRIRAAIRDLGEDPRVTGPLAADAAFRVHVTGGSDAVLAMYHDQATVAAKVADPFGCVNYTMGLGFPRTSPDHGTADEIAGRGVAEPRSMIEATLLAARIAARCGSLPDMLGSLVATLDGSV